MHPTDDQHNDAFERTLGGLEQLAGELDARKYPGQAWPAAVGRRPAPRRWVWKIGASIAAAAAGIVVTLHYWPASARPVVPVSQGPHRVAPVAPQKSQVSDETALPRIIIVEDMDSYSIIDLNNSVPLVSFVSKRAFNLDDTTPILVDWAAECGL